MRELVYLFCNFGEEMDCLWLMKTLDEKQLGNFLGRWVGLIMPGTCRLVLHRQLWINPVPLQVECGNPFPP